ncbi:MAG: hypothetical protein K1X66_08360 [Verrucomicrobiae bacterium]|nr:hypothetical protein [Verrucomicrobiae bacterium]
MRLFLFICFSVTLSSWGAYQEPNLNREIFDLSKISLNEKEKDQTAATLTQAAISRPDPVGKDAVFCSKIFAIALRLAPNYEAAVVANYQLTRGLKPKSPEKLLNGSELATALYVTSQQLRKSGTENDDKLANYLLDLVVEMDPRNESAIVEREKLKRSVSWIDWSEVVDEASVTSLLEAPEVVQGDQKGAASFVRSQSTINGLVVRQQPDGQFQGGTLEIIATVEKGDPKFTSYCLFNRAVGRDMTISLDEAMRAVKVLHPVWESGRVIKISFDDKYSDKDGGSAGTAFTLVLLSLLEDIKIDSLFAITGDITVDHNVRKIGKAPEKIRGATLAGCQLVAIPTANEEDIDDMGLLYPLKSLSEIQIFSVATLEDALALARVDKPEKVNQAIELFSSVQKVAMGTSEAYLKVPRIQAILRQVLELAPNHLSARYLLRRAEGKTPNTLSFLASLDEIFVALNPFWQSLYYDASTQAQYGSRQTLYSIPEETVENSLSRLKRVQLKLHPRTSELKDNLMDYLVMWQRLQKGGTVSAGSLLELSKKAKTVLGIWEKLKTDRETLETYSRK